MSAVIDVVLPCLDEAAALPWVLERLPEQARAIVVDNGSSDGSAQLAESLGATVIPCAQPGYGAACHAGLLAATALSVAFCDCDGSLDPRDVLRLLAAVDREDVLAIARRRPVSRQAQSLTSRIINRELARRVRHRTHQQIHDVGPLRVARREALLRLGVADRRFGYPVQTLLRAADAGWRIEQVDVAYRPRIGRSKVTGTVRGTLRAVRDIRVALAE